MRYAQIGWAMVVVTLTGCLTSSTSAPGEVPERARVVADSKLNRTQEQKLLDENSTLADYLAYAALNNPGLEAAFNRWRAALEKIARVRALPDPKFNYGYYIREVETRVGPQRHRLGLAQMFPWFGTLKLRGDVAAEEAQVARQQFEAAKLKLFFQVKEAYFELYYLRQAITVTGDNLQLLKHLESVAQSRFKGGAPVTGVVKAQLELSRVSDRLMTLEQLREPVSARLNAALNRPLEAALPWPQPAPWEGELVDGEALSDWLVEGNPELKGLEAEVRRHEKAEALARKSYFPDLTLGVDYIETGDAINPSMPDSGKDPLVAQFSISLPLWRQKYRAEASEARAQAEASRQTRLNRENLLLADLRMALYRFRDAERKIGLYRHTLVPQARGAMGVAQASYESGKTDFLNLIDAQRLLLQYELEAERAVADRELRLAEIEMLLGRELPTEPSQREENP